MKNSDFCPPTLKALLPLMALMMSAEVHAQCDATSAAAATRKVVLIGASYARGWGTPALPGWQLTNKGQGGEETTQMLARFDRDVIAARPDAVLIWGHINDIFRAPGGDMAAAATRAKANHAEMMRRASQAGIEVMLATEITLSESTGFINWAKSVVRDLRGKQSYQERVNAQVRAVNDYLRADAARHGRLLLDLERAVDDGNGYRRGEYSTDDGSHVSPAGYAALTSFARRELDARIAAACKSARS
jgi:lysophospholipase L1-like esterase